MKDRYRKLIVLLFASGTSALTAVLASPQVRTMIALPGGSAAAVSLSQKVGAAAEGSSGQQALSEATNDLSSDAPLDPKHRVEKDFGDIVPGVYRALAGHNKSGNSSLAARTWEAERALLTCLAKESMQANAAADPRGDEVDVMVLRDALARYLKLSAQLRGRYLAENSTGRDL